LDQYINFNQQREQFVERFQLLAQDKLKIQELMDGLDRQKEEAIWRTFQGVSKHFSEVFRELVPFGEGSLIMVKAADSLTESSVEEFFREEKVSQGSYHGPSIDEFLGVRVKVSFSDAIQQFEMHQLSGGQKALVALAIIFAIQRFVHLTFCPVLGTNADDVTDATLLHFIFLMKLIKLWMQIIGWLLLV
jgi:structural maintenance of chromosome 3 (chondroitin sulfate proteoglycan 6)